MRTCSKCHEHQPLESFSRDKYATAGRRYECKTCCSERRKANYRANREWQLATAREWRQKHPEKNRKYANDSYWRRRDWVLARDRELKFGISPESYEQMRQDQGGLCAICRRECSRWGKTLSVDHCHDTGQIRGLLCGSCNLALGKFSHDPEVLRRAADYLEEAMVV